VRKHTEVRARLERLRASEAALKDRIVGLQALVTSQKDAQVKQYNQGLLARAETMLKDLGRTLEEIERDDAQTKARATELTSQQDEVAMRALAEQLKARWNRASRYQDDIGRLLRGLTELGTSATVSSTGGVGIRRPGQDLRPIARGQAMTLLPGDTIVTGANSHAELVLTDGSRIVLQANSQFTLDPDAGNEAAGMLKQGLMRLSELVGCRHKKIRTPTVAIAVRGTDFILTADRGQTRCLVSSGEVEVTAGERTLVLHALEEATLSGGQEEPKASPLPAGDFDRLADEVAPDIR
jgi:ferric-dicitrate binding protein FerR (iron transport regulator)